jgi:hypothetical protein
VGGEAGGGIGVQPTFLRRAGSKLEGLHVCVCPGSRMNTPKARELSWLVMEISNALVDLGMLPIWDIP